MAQRHADSDKPIVCVMDGEKSLWEMRDLFQGQLRMVDVLDLLHVGAAIVGRRVAVS